MSSRRIEDLRPGARERCKSFLLACGAAGIDVLITGTLRTLDEQAALYAQGRTAPGRIVTNAKPGRSFHNYGLAFDFAPLKHGKIDWHDVELFKRCGEIGETCGLEWAGRWKSFKELAHLQYTGGLTIDDLIAGKRLLE